MIKAIPTMYKGIAFRSRLEAKWAVFFDQLKIPYNYEAEGFDLDGVRYLPDFYLPDCDEFFEVKGIMNDFDEEKVMRLAIATGKKVIVGYDDGKFYVYESYEEGGKIECGYWDGMLCYCLKCKKFFFVGGLSWACTCCGAYDGNAHFWPVWFSCGRDYPVLDWDLWARPRNERFGEFSKEKEAAYGQ